MKGDDTMKTYWKKVIHVGVISVFLTSLVVTANSGTEKEQRVSPQYKLSSTMIKNTARTNKTIDQDELERKEEQMITMVKKETAKKQIMKSEVKPPVAKAVAKQSKPVVSKTPQKAQPQVKQPPKAQPLKAQPQKKPVESSFYVKSIPMPYDQQKYLYNLSKQRGLDYKEMLAFIKHESEFRATVVGGGNSFGYFQVNKVNHSRLSQTLKTKNDPFDPYVNINWGTYLVSELYQKYRGQGLSGTALKEAVLSAYNKGEGGYAKTGKAVAYIQKHNQSLNYIQNRI